MSEAGHRSRRIGARALLSQAFLAVFLALAPSTVEPWRLDPLIRHAVTLPVGAPVRMLEPSAARR